jgi:hypothetical protein
MATRVRLWRAGAEEHKIKVLLRGDDPAAMHAHLIGQAIAHLGDRDDIDPALLSIKLTPPFVVCCIASHNSFAFVALFRSCRSLGMYL